MVEKKPVQVRIAESRKERWEQEVEQNPDWRSLTDLIVTSVEMSIRGGGMTGNGGSVDVDLGRVEDRFDDISNQLNDIEDRIDETYFLVREEKSQYTAITARLHELIPEVHDRDQILKREPTDRPKETDDLEQTIDRTGSASHLITMLKREGFKQENVKDAIERLAEESATVELVWADPKNEDDKRVFRVVD